MKLFSNTAGFSLLELLVVVSILGILMTMGYVSFNTVQRNARDAQRQADLTALGKALESSFALHSGYTCSESELQDDTLIENFPLDPKTKEPPELRNAGNDDELGYVYSACTSSTYCFCAKMEKNDNGNSADSACSFQENGDYFCIQQRN